MRVEGINSTQPITRISNSSVDSDGGIRRSSNEELRDVEKNEFSREGTLNSGEKDSEKLSIGEKQLIEAIEKANKALRGVDKRFEFSIHEETKEIIIKVINEETDEVIREIPPEKILDMVAKMWELAGILVDRKI